MTISSRGRVPASASSRRATCRSAPAAHRHAHVETIVIGAGAAGAAAATEAVARGHRVLLVGEHHVVEDPVDGATTLAATTAAGIYDDGYVVLYQRSRPVEVVWHVRARHVVLATGAHERPIAFAGNDLPGVMLAGAAARYAARFGVLAGERAVVFTTNHAGTDGGGSRSRVGRRARHRGRRGTRRPRGRPGARRRARRPHRRGDRRRRRATRGWRRSRSATPPAT